MFLPSANHHHVSWKVKINNFFASHKFCLSQLEGEDKHCFANDIFILREKTFWPDYFESLATPPYLGRESFAQWTADGTQIRIKSSTKLLISLWFKSKFSRFSKEIFSCDAVFTCGEEPEVVLDPVNKRHCQKIWKHTNKTKCKSKMTKIVKKIWRKKRKWQKLKSLSPECELASSECQEPEDEMWTLYSESPAVCHKGLFQPNKRTGKVVSSYSSSQFSLGWHKARELGNRVPQ